jgi:hypothetical protein
MDVGCDGADLKVDGRKSEAGVGLACDEMQARAGLSSLIDIQIVPF